MLVPDATVKRKWMFATKTVTNILPLSPTHFVSNIRHQYRCNQRRNILSIYRDKIRQRGPRAKNIATNFVAIFIISVTKICAILPNIATKDQKKSFVASGGNIAKIFVTLMTDVGVYVGDK